MFNFFSTVPSVSPDEVLRQVDDQTAVLIDVRSALEYEGGHARGARNIPLETVSRHVEALATYARVFVICASGGRSAQAVSLLLSRGVHAVNVSGGTVAWQHAGLPMVTS